MVAEHRDRELCAVLEAAIREGSVASVASVVASATSMAGSAAGSGRAAGSDSAGGSAGGIAGGIAGGTAAEGGGGGSGARELNAAISEGLTHVEQCDPHRRGSAMSSGTYDSISPFDEQASSFLQASMRARELLATARFAKLLREGISRGTWEDRGPCHVGGLAEGRAGRGGASVTPDVTPEGGQAGGQGTDSRPWRCLPFTDVVASAAAFFTGGGQGVGGMHESGRRHEGDPSHPAPAARDSPPPIDELENRMSVQGALRHLDSDSESETDLRMDMGGQVELLSDELKLAQHTLNERAMLVQLTHACVTGCVQGRVGKLDVSAVDVVAPALALEALFDPRAGFGGHDLTTAAPETRALATATSVLLEARRTVLAALAPNGAGAANGGSDSTTSVTLVTSSVCEWDRVVVSSESSLSLSSGEADDYSVETLAPPMTFSALLDGESLISAARAAPSGVSAPELELIAAAAEDARLALSLRSALGRARPRAARRGRMLLSAPSAAAAASGMGETDGRVAACCNAAPLAQAVLRARANAHAHATARADSEHGAGGTDGVIDGTESVGVSSAVGAVGAVDAVDAVDWIESLDDTTGHTYYYNTKTEESSWTPPPGWGDSRGDSGSNGNDGTPSGDVAEAPASTVGAAVGSTSLPVASDRRDGQSRSRECAIAFANAEVLLELRTIAAERSVEVGVGDGGAAGVGLGSTTSIPCDHKDADGAQDGARTEADADVEDVEANALLPRLSNARIAAALRTVRKLRAAGELLVGTLREATLIEAEARRRTACAALRVALAAGGVVLQSGDESDESDAQRADAGVTQLVVTDVVLAPLEEALDRAVAWQTRFCPTADASGIASALNSGGVLVQLMNTANLTLELRRALLATATSPTHWRTVRALLKRVRGTTGCSLADGAPGGGGIAACANEWRLAQAQDDERRIACTLAAALAWVPPARAASAASPDNATAAGLGGRSAHRPDASAASALAAADPTATSPASDGLRSRFDIAEAVRTAVTTVSRCFTVYADAESGPRSAECAAMLDSSLDKGIATRGERNERNVQVEAELIDAALEDAQAAAAAAANNNNNNNNNDAITAPVVDVARLLTLERAIVACHAPSRAAPRSRVGRELLDAARLVLSLRAAARRGVYEDEHEDTLVQKPLTPMPWTDFGSASARVVARAAGRTQPTNASINRAGWWCRGGAALSKVTSVHEALRHAVVLGAVGDDSSEAMPSSVPSPSIASTLIARELGWWRDLVGERNTMRELSAALRQNGATGALNARRAVGQAMGQGLLQAGQAGGVARIASDGSDRASAEDDALVTAATMSCNGISARALNTIDCRALRDALARATERHSTGSELYDGERLIDSATCSIYASAKLTLAFREAQLATRHAAGGDGNGGIGGVAPSVVGTGTGKGDDADGASDAALDAVRQLLVGSTKDTEDDAAVARGGGDDADDAQRPEAVFSGYSVAEAAGQVRRGHAPVWLTPNPAVVELNAVADDLACTTAALELLYAVSHNGVAGAAGSSGMRRGGWSAALATDPPSVQPQRLRAALDGSAQLAAQSNALASLAELLEEIHIIRVAAVASVPSPSSSKSVGVEWALIAGALSRIPRKLRVSRAAALRAHELSDSGMSPSACLKAADAAQVEASAASAALEHRRALIRLTRALARGAVSFGRHGLDVRLTAEPGTGAGGGADERASGGGMGNGTGALEAAIEYSKAQHWQATSDVGDTERDTEEESSMALMTRADAPSSSEKYARALLDVATLIASLRRGCLAFAAASLRAHGSEQARQAHTRSRVSILSQHAGTMAMARAAPTGIGFGTFVDELDQSPPRANIAGSVGTTAGDGFAGPANVDIDYNGYGDASNEDGHDDGWIEEWEGALPEALRRLAAAIERARDAALVADVQIANSPADYDVDDDGFVGGGRERMPPFPGPGLLGHELAALSAFAYDRAKTRALHSTLQLSAGALQLTTENSASSLRSTQPLTRERADNNVVALREALSLTPTMTSIGRVGADVPSEASEAPAPALLSLPAFGDGSFEAPAPAALAGSTTANPENAENAGNAENMEGLAPERGSSSPSCTRARLESSASSAWVLRRAAAMRDWAALGDCVLESASSSRASHSHTVVSGSAPSGAASGLSSGLGAAASASSELAAAAVHNAWRQCASAFADALLVPSAVPHSLGWASSPSAALASGAIDSAASLLESCITSAASRISPLLSAGGAFGGGFGSGGAQQWSARVAQQLRPFESLALSALATRKAAAAWGDTGASDSAAADALRVALTEHNNKLAPFLQGGESALISTFGEQLGSQIAKVVAALALDHAALQSELGDAQARVL